MKDFVGYKKGINMGLWLSQFRKFDLNHFETYNTKQDVEFIASCGFDHIRLPFDYELFKNNVGFKFLDRAIGWCKECGLNVVLDLHRANGFAFGTLDKNQLFTSPKLQKEFVNLWVSIAKHYKNEGDNLCFELLNEVVTPNAEDWNNLYIKSVKEIRKISKTRTIIVGGNHYGSAKQLNNLRLLADENIVYTFHFYKPMIFSHQKASWCSYKNITEQVPYPVPKDVFNTQSKIVGEYKHVEEDVSYSQLANWMQPAVDFATKNNVIVYCGEFGVIEFADEKSTTNWFKDVLKFLTKNNIGRAAWNYKEKKFKLENFATGKPNKKLFKLLAK